MTNVIEVFNEEQINKKLNKDFKDWTFDGKWIRKTYKTHSWKGTLMLVNAIGHLSEIAWHHPDLVVSYAFVEVKLMNHAKNTTRWAADSPSGGLFSKLAKEHHRMLLSNKMLKALPHTEQLAKPMESCLLLNQIF